MPLAKPKTFPDPPADLSDEAKDLWDRIHERWVLDDARCAMLRQSLYSFDRAEQARKQLNEVGLVVQDRYGQIRPHPAARVEEVSRAAFLAGLKALGLDIVPPSKPRMRG
jgi:hypothetical protein